MAGRFCRPANLHFMGDDLRFGAAGRALPENHLSNQFYSA
jgi:hypothetical protein